MYNNISLGPCGAMEARKTSNLKVAGSSPAMDFMLLYFYDINIMYI